MYILGSVTCILMRENCDLISSITDHSTGLTWVRSPSAIFYSWRNAMMVTNNNDGALPGSLCGYNDWCLPSANEFATLINSAGNMSPEVYLNSHGFSNIQANYYWTSNNNGNIVKLLKYILWVS